MLENARVVKVFPKGKLAESYLLLEVDRPQSSCSSCTQETSCGQSTFSKLLNPKTALIELPNSVGANVGDQVKLEVPEELGLLAACLVFGLPLLFLMLVPVLLSTLFHVEGDISLALSSFLGLALGSFFSRSIATKIMSKPQNIPRIKGIMLSSQ